MMAYINAAGLAMPPMFVVKGKMQRCVNSVKTQDGPKGSSWTYQQKAWMEDELVIGWFQRVFLKQCGEERPQLLLLDCHHSHETLSLLEAAKAENIIIMAIP